MVVKQIFRMFSCPGEEVGIDYFILSELEYVKEAFKTFTIRLKVRCSRRYFQNIGLWPNFLLYSHCDWTSFSSRKWRCTLNWTSWHRNWVRGRTVLNSSYRGEMSGTMADSKMVRIRLIPKSRSSTDSLYGLRGGDVSWRVNKYWGIHSSFWHLDFESRSSQSRSAITPILGSVRCQICTVFCFSDRRR